MGQSSSKAVVTKKPVNRSYLDNYRFLSDHNLYMSLENLGYKLTEEQKQKAKHDGGVTFYQLGELNYEMEKYVEAYTWFAKAAAQKNSDAQTSLGFMYERNDMGLVNNGVSKYWYTQADLNDRNRHAQCGLANIYDQGRGVPRDYIKALEWYVRAAQQNHPIAQFSLARMYEHIEAFRDLRKAVNWYKASYLNGFEEGKAEMEKLKKGGFHPTVNDKAFGPLIIATQSAPLVKNQVIIVERTTKHQKASSKSSHSRTNSKNSKRIAKVFQVDTSPIYSDKKMYKKRMIIMLETIDKLQAELDAIRAE